MGHAICVINCFTISGFTLRQKNGEAANVTKARKREDENLGSLFKHASFIDLDLLDAPLRHEPVRQALPLSGKQVDLARSIENRVIQMAPAGSTVYWPLSVGNHIDHLICLEAAIGCWGIHTYRMTFYEDLPYASRYAAAEVLNKVSYIQDRVKTPLHPKLHRFTNHQRKRELIRFYPSQVDERIEEEIMRYTAQKGGERVWRCKTKRGDV